ncbi:hypothetical protein PENSPDRAFT_738370 [Peniophora sp. CONT]|nr:hypothetical protein PENSPDRAFT_738370 [Peniophora sp. CONT]
MTIHSPASQYWSAQVQERMMSLRRDEIWATGSLKKRAELADQLNDEAEALQDIVYLLKRQANACRPISALPPEVFGHIVDIVVDEQPPSWGVHDIPEAKSLVDIGWISLKLVCKDWRDICMTSANCWATRAHTLTTERLSITTGLEGRGADVSKTFYITAPIATCLRVLRLYGLNRLSLAGVLDTLRRMPSLDSLDFASCQWNISDHPTHTPEIVHVEKLKWLRLSDQTDNDNEDASWDILYSLRLSHVGVNIYLGLHLAHDPESNAAMLNYSLLLAAQRIAHVDISLCVHLGRDGIFMTNMPSLNRQALSVLLDDTHGTTWQVAIKKDIPVKSNLIPAVLSALSLINDDYEPFIDGLRRTELLSLYMNRHSPRLVVGEPFVFALFGIFSNIRALHIAGTIGCSDAANIPGLPIILRILSEGAEIPVPRLEQLWLCPLYLTEGARSLSLLYDLLQNRVARPSSVLLTIHVDVPRPSTSDDARASQAVAFENLVPHFTWR